MFKLQIFTDFKTKDTITYSERFPYDPYISVMIRYAFKMKFSMINSRMKNELMIYYKYIINIIFYFMHNH